MKRKPVKGERVTTMYGKNWGTIENVTDVSIPGAGAKGLRKYMCSVRWDGVIKLDLVRADFLIWEGEEILGKKFTEHE